MGRSLWKCLTLVFVYPRKVHLVECGGFLFPDQLIFRQPICTDLGSSMAASRTSPYHDSSGQSSARQSTVIQTRGVTYNKSTCLCSATILWADGKK